jgi:hypothetical protein
VTGSLRIHGRRRAEDRERIVSDALRGRRSRSAALIAAAEVWLKSRIAQLSKVATRCATGTNVSPLGSVTFAGRSASGPIPPGQSEAANDCECTDHDPDAVACHEALGHDLRVDSLKHPDSTHQGDDNTYSDSCNPHVRIVDPEADRRARYRCAYSLCVERAGASDRALTGWSRGGDDCGRM